MAGLGVREGQLRNAQPRTDQVEQDNDAAANTASLAQENGVGQRRGRIALFAIVGIVLACAAISVFSGSFGVLAALLFPPTPPTIPNATEIAHTSETWGMDEWNYDVSGAPAAIGEQLAAAGGTCITDWPDMHNPDHDDYGATLRCEDDMPFARFSQHWTATLWPIDETRSRMVMKRVVRWGG